MQRPAGEPLGICIRDIYKCHMQEIASLSWSELETLRKQVRFERLLRAERWHACARCGTSFLARAGAAYCSGRCRTADYRIRLKESA